MIDLNQDVRKRFDEFRDYVVDFQKEFVLRNDFSKNCPTLPIVYLLMGDKINVVAVGTSDHSPMDSLKPIVAEFKPECYVFCSEAWIKIMDGLKKDEIRETEKKISEVGVRGLKDKKEIYLMLYGKYNGEVEQLAYDIIRNGERKIIKLVENEKHHFKNNDSSFKSEKIP